MRKHLQILAASAALAGLVPASADAFCLVCIDRHPGRDPGVHARDLIPGDRRHFERPLDTGRHNHATEDTGRTAPGGEDDPILDSIAQDTARIDRRQATDCDTARTLYLLRHGHERTPRPLRRLHGCARWREDMRYHHGLPPSGPLAGGVAGAVAAS